MATTIIIILCMRESPLRQAKAIWGRFTRWEPVGHGKLFARPFFRRPKWWNIVKMTKIPRSDVA
ncbi:hypothetical protein [Roseicella frigidaeris]|uniref:hypothetical protein n=1 Tax=Roseicella frigidaeris TaxID=2230885 RepID=UPI001403448B|nr:hypothetical protein [Roseicella frigidaeris]